MRDRFAVVAFGGGTGLPVLLRACGERAATRLQRFVTVADDEGSSGRLRQELGIAPPGDVRNCLVVLPNRVVAEFGAAGSLFTSTIPPLLGAGVPDALAAFAGPIVYAANIMTQPGETAGFTLSDHLQAIAEHVGSVVSDVLVRRERLPEQVLSRYCAEGAAPVQIDREGIERLGVRVHRARLLPDAMDAEMRHDPDRLALAVHDVGAEVRRLAR